MTNKAIKMVAPPEVYRWRRVDLAAGLTRPIVLAAGRARGRNMPTMTHPFRAGSSYLYFGGPPIEGAALVIEPQAAGDEGCTLLRPVAGFEEAVWVGEVPSDEQLGAASGVDVKRMAPPESLKSLLGGRTGAYIAPPCPPTLAWIADANLEPPTPDELLLLIQMRLPKDEHELAAMRRAASVTVEAHLAAMRATTPGHNEADVAAALAAVYTAHECIPSFSPIVSVHGEVLHSDTYPDKLEAGNLLLVDSGAEEPGGYAGDVTRTYPVTGVYSGVQRQLYETVLRAHRAGIEACLPGRRFREVHDTATRMLCEGLVEANLVRGNPADLADRGAHTLFMPHGVGHLIGLDVHDMEDFGDLAGYPSDRPRPTEFGTKWLRLDRNLEAGMVVTIEPGVYLVPAIWRQDELTRPFADVVNRPAVDALLDGGFGGIRIEDTVHVCPFSDGGPEVLTADLPTDADEVASIVGAA